MKTSNKIIIAFSVFIVGGIFTLFSTAKGHEKKSKEAFCYRTFQLKPFSVVIAEDSAIAKITSTSLATITEKDSNGKITSQRQEEMNEIGIRYNKENPQNLQKMFKQKGDTLFLYAGAKLSVKTSGKIKTVIGHRPLLLFLEGVKTDSIIQNGGKTNIARIASHDKKLLLNLKNNARVYMISAEINQLNILSDSSSLWIEGGGNDKPIGLNAKIKRQSVLETQDIFSPVNIEKDQGSKYRVAEYVGTSATLNDFDNIMP